YGASMRRWACPTSAVSRRTSERTSIPSPVTARTRSPNLLPTCGVGSPWNGGGVSTRGDMRPRPAQPFRRRNHYQDDLRGANPIPPGSDIMATFAELSIPFLLFEAPTTEASDYAGSATCRLCGGRDRHCFELGIGDALIWPCPDCGAENGLDAHDRA